MRISSKTSTLAVAAILSLSMLAGLALTTEETDAATTWINISTKEDLQRIGTDVEYPAGSGVMWTNSASYRMTADIELTGTDNLMPIGSGTNKFSGIFDGRGYTIDGLNQSEAMNPGAFGSRFPMGLFGYIDGGTVKNLNLTNIDILGNYPGAIAYTMFSSAGPALIEKCTITGAVSNFGYASMMGSYAGGIVTWIVADGNSVTVRECSIDVTVYTEDDNADAISGGIAGHINVEHGNAFFINCVNKGEVVAYSRGTEPYMHSSTGGFAGEVGVMNDGDSIQFINCVNTGDVVAQYGVTKYAGGTIGSIYWSSATLPVFFLINCYSTDILVSELFNVQIPSLAALVVIDGVSTPPRLTNQASGVYTMLEMETTQEEAAAGTSIFYTGITTLPDSTTASGFDFVNIWSIGEDGLPDVDLSSGTVDPTEPDKDDTDGLTLHQIIGIMMAMILITTLMGYWRGGGAGAMVGLSIGAVLTLIFAKLMGVF